MTYNNNLQQAKDAFRSQSLKRLKHLANSSNAYKKDKEITRKLIGLLRKSNSSAVMVYVPLEIEYDIFYIINYLRKLKKTVFVPFMEGKSFRLVQYRLPLKKNSYGIKEPIDSKKNTKKSIDLAIVPIVGTDFTFRRVGFGKGMYDRFFSKQKYIRTTVFVARKLCYTQELITSSHDIRADAICVSRASLPKRLRYNKYFI